MSDKKKKKVVDKDHTIEYLVGLALLAAGLVILAQKITVTSGWYMFHFGAFSMSSGLITVPLILSFIWYVVRPTKRAPKVCLILSVVILIACLILSTKFYFSNATLFDYLVMFGLIGGGTGLILREHFDNKKNN